MNDLETIRKTAYRVREQCERYAIKNRDWFDKDSLGGMCAVASYTVTLNLDISRH